MIKFQSFTHERAPGKNWIFHVLCMYEFKIDTHNKFLNCSIEYESARARQTRKNLIWFRIIHIYCIILRICHHHAQKLINKTRKYSLCNHMECNYRATMNLNMHVVSHSIVKKILNQLFEKTQTFSPFRLVAIKIA